MRAMFGDRANGRRLMLGLIAIGALLVLDVVLIALALANVGPSTLIAPRAPIGSPAPIDAPASKPVRESPDASPAPPPEATGLRSHGTRRLSAASDTVAWRAIVGDCGDPGTFEVTTDGGSTWSTAGLDVRGPVLSLEPNADRRRGLAVVGNSACEPIVHRTFTAARGWEVAPDQRAGTYVTPDGKLLLNGVTMEAPCDDPAVAVGSGDGVVLCGDVGHARAGSGEWVAIGDGVVAIGPASNGVAVALRSVEGCYGLAVGTISAGTPAIACTETSADAAVAVSASGTWVWAWSGDRTLIQRLG